MKFDLFWRYKQKVGEIQIDDMTLLELIENSIDSEPLCLVPRILKKYDGSLDKEVYRKIIDLSIIPLRYHKNKEM